MSTPNMGLTLPVDHGSADVWDTILDAIFNTIDAHDHTAGKGVKVPSAGLNINADVSWSSGGSNYGITDLKAIDFAAVTAASVAALAGAFFVNSADSELYYRTVGGSNVKVTNGAALNVAAFTGGIGGDYAAVGALESFDDATDSYWFQQQGSPRPWARLRSGDVDIYETAASIANRVRLQSPGALAASYAITLLTALPATQKLLQITGGGALLATNVLANNENIQLQGTGYLQHGDRHLSCPVVYPDFVLNSGTINNNGTKAGAALAVSSSGYFPLRGMESGMRVKSITPHLDNTPGAAITYQLYLGSTSLGAFSFSALGGNLSSAGTDPLYTMSAPYAAGYPVANGETLYVLVTTPGGATCKPTSFEVVYDRP